MSIDAALSLLRELHNPTTSDDRKLFADSQLRAFVKSTEALEWALQCLKAGQSDWYGQYLVAMVLQSASLQCERLPQPLRGALFESLWRSTTVSPICTDRFLASKFDVAMAQVACLDWKPDFWDDLHRFTLENYATAERGLTLLRVVIEELYSMSQISSTSLTGKVLVAQVPIMAIRLVHAHVMARNIIISVLEQIKDVALDVYEVSATLTLCLQVFRVISSSRSFLGPEHDQFELQVKTLSLLLHVVSRLATPNCAIKDGDLPQLAMICIEDELSGPLPPVPLAGLLKSVILTLTLVASALKEQSSDDGALLQYDPSMLAHFTHLVILVLRRSMPLRNDSLDALSGTLATATVDMLLTVAGRRWTPEMLLLGAEIGHMAMEWLEDLEAAEWSDDMRNRQALDEGSAKINLIYKQVILRVANAVFDVWLKPQLQHVIANMSDHVESGVCLEEYMSPFDLPGAELPMKADDAMEATSVDDDEVDVLNPSARGDAPSELDVFAEYTESFIDRAIGAFGNDVIPVILENLLPSIAYLHEAQAAFDQGTPAGKINLLLRRLDFLLTLSGRCCGYTLPNVDAYLSVDPFFSSLPGAPIASLLRIFIQFGRNWMQTLHSTATSSGRMPELQFCRLGGTAFRATAAALTTWLPRVMLQADESPEQAKGAVIQLLVDTMEYCAQGGVLLSLAPRWPDPRLAPAVAQCLLAMTSIALSSDLKPPAMVLNAVSSCHGVQILSGIFRGAFLPQGGHCLLPRSVIRAMGVTLSDVSLRSWGMQIKTGRTTIEARQEAFAAAMNPILSCLTQACALGGHQTSPECLQLAWQTATEVVRTYAGSSKPVRTAAYTAVGHPLLQCVASSVRGRLQQEENAPAGGVPSSKMISKALLRIVSACFQVFPTEIDPAMVNELLASFHELADPYRAVPPGVGVPDMQASEEAMDSNVSILSLAIIVLDHGSDKHISLLSPTMEFAAMLWVRAEALFATRVKAQVLGCMLSLLWRHWRKVCGEPDRCATDIVSATLTKLGKFLDDAGDGRIVPAAGDVRFVLENLFQLQLASKLYWRSWFDYRKENLMDSIMRMLVSRMYTAAQDDLIDTLYGLAASNWSSFHLGFIPCFIERRMKVLRPRAAEIAAIFGVTDMGPSDFESAVKGFLNNTLFWEAHI